MQKGFQIARKNLTNSKEISKANYDKTINPRVYQIGEQALLKNATRLSKLSAHLTGPHEVIEVHNPVNVSLNIKNKKKKLHVNRLKPFKE